MLVGGYVQAFRRQKNKALDPSHIGGSIQTSGINMSINPVSLQLANQQIS
jgi:hypothetical protein